MLSKDKRLNLKTTFRFVAGGKHIDLGEFKIMFRLSDNAHPLVGVSVSSKELKSAVERNSAKRLAFNSVQEVYALLQSNLNLVIMPRAGFLKLPQEIVTNKLKEALNVGSITN